jgi:hypothetical protein
MTCLGDGPIGAILVACLLALATALGLRSARIVRAALLDARALDLVRGIRVAILAFVAAVSALGVHSGQAGFLVLGGLVLAEELYETGVLALILRRGERA